jgi:putative glycerol-1-phosphate prenyltransferase
MSACLKKIFEAKAEKRTLLAVLIDPEKCFGQRLIDFVKIINIAQSDFIFVGGSQMQSSMQQAINEIKKITEIPVVLFPGNSMQFCGNADAMLFLTLISGRNPNYLIGQQVKSARKIKNSGVETISTGYILIDGGTKSAVQKVSATKPLKDMEKIVDTAIAGELLGCKAIYLEAGSGAQSPVNQKIITEVRKNISVPLIVGGGLCSIEMLQKAMDAGADILVAGNLFEIFPEKVIEFTNKVKNS